MQPMIYEVIQKIKVAQFFWDTVYKRRPIGG